MRGKIKQAFAEVHQGFSADRIVADTELNLRFVDACCALGLDDQPVDLNQCLLNMRRAGKQLAKTTQRTTFKDQGAYAFAAEIAIRSLERKHRTTLDRVLCDPVLAEEFDAVAALMAPGFTPLGYRWAALRLRKTKKLSPEMLVRVVPTQVYGPIVASQLDLSSVPLDQGLYVVTSRTKALYVGEAHNLRNRLKKHLDHSDNKLLARYIWEFGDEDLFIEYHVLPDDTRTDVRKAMELELIRSRRAEFNVQR